MKQTDIGIWILDGGVCAQTDPETFFPEKGAARSTRAAKRMCMTCPIREQCLELALSDDPREEWKSMYGDFGVWGGKSKAERRKIRAERQAAQDEEAAREAAAAAPDDERLAS